MSGAQRCDEILRLIDQVLADCDSQPTTTPRRSMRRLAQAPDPKHDGPTTAASAR